MTRVQFLAGTGIYPFAIISRPGLGPTQPPTQQMLEESLKLTIHLHGKVLSYTGVFTFTLHK
jgi:hypothetical protein